MSEKSKGDVSSSSSTSSPRIVKNPLLSASVTGLTFDDFPNKPQLLPAAPPIIHAPPPSHINPILLTGILNRETKTLVTVGSAASLDTDDNLDEINLDSSCEDTQQQQQQHHHHQQLLHPFSLDDKANANSSNSLLDEPAKFENESILSQAASSFTALPSVASNVFSTFSKRIYSSTTNSGSGSRERTPFNEQQQDEINANAQLDIQPSYIQQQPSQLQYHTIPPSVVAPATPFVPILSGELPPSLPQITSSLTEESLGNLPEPPKFYTPTELRSLPSASLSLATPSGSTTNTQNTYRSITKKKFYAPIPGLSHDKPIPQQQQQQPQQQKNILPPNTPTFLIPPYPEATPQQFNSQQPFDVQTQTQYHYPTETKPEERKSSGGGLFTGVLQNLTGLVQSAAGSLAYQTPESTVATQQPTPGPEVTLKTNSYFSESSPQIFTPPPIFGSTTSVAAAPPPTPVSGYFAEQKSTTIASLITPPPPSAPADIILNSPLQVEQRSSDLSVPPPIPQHQSVGAIQPPRTVGQTSFRLQKGTRLYKNPLTQQETAPVPAVSSLVNQPVPPGHYQQKPIGIFNPFEGTTSVTVAPASLPPPQQKQHQLQPTSESFALVDSSKESTIEPPLLFAAQSTPISFSGVVPPLPQQQNIQSQLQQKQQQQTLPPLPSTIFDSFPLTSTTLGEENKVESIPQTPSQLTPLVEGSATKLPIIYNPTQSIFDEPPPPLLIPLPQQQQEQQKLQEPLNIFNPFATPTAENKKSTQGFVNQSITAPPEIFNQSGQTTATTTPSTHWPVEQLTQKREDVVLAPPLTSITNSLQHISLTEEPVANVNLISEAIQSDQPLDQSSIRDNETLNISPQQIQEYPANLPIINPPSSDSSSLFNQESNNDTKTSEQLNQFATLSHFFTQTTTTNDQTGSGSSASRGLNFFETPVENISYQPTAPSIEPPASNFFATQEPPSQSSSSSVTEHIGFVLPTSPEETNNPGIIQFNSDQSLSIGFDNFLEPNNTKKFEAENSTNSNLNNIEYNCQNFNTTNPDSDLALHKNSFSKYFSDAQNSYVNSFNSDDVQLPQSTINAGQLQHQTQQQQNQGLEKKHQQYDQENLIDSSKFFDSFASTSSYHQLQSEAAEVPSPPTISLNENLIDSGNGNGDGQCVVNQSSAFTTISNEDQRIQNFFNNPPPKENSAGIGDLNYDLVHSGLAVKNLETRSQTSISNLVEPPSSACSDFSELNNSINQQQQHQPQQQQQQQQLQQQKPQQDLEQQYREGELTLLNNSNSNHNLIDNSNILNQYPDYILEYIEMANAQSERDGLANLTYSPVVNHWFYTRLVDNKLVWQPFSHYDSALLETSLMSADDDNAAIADDESCNLVPVEGGRYDVNIRERTKRPVYWEGSGIEVRRCSWFFKGVDSKYVPYDEETAKLLEAKYKNCFETGVWHQKIELSTGEQWVMIHGPSVIVHFHQQHNVDAWGGVSQTSVRPRIVKRDLLDFKIEQGESQRVDHLLFMVHGIGSACDLKMRTVEEVVGDFREIAQHLIQSHYKNSSEMGIVGRVEVLPISWHSHLHSEEMGIDEKLKSITLESIPKLRNFTNDTLLDVLFYTSPTFCQKIMNTVATSLNEVYLKYRSRHPDFNGGVSLAGHSLGSLILFDLLCHQEPIKECEEQNMENPDQHLQAITTTILNGSNDGISKHISYTMGPAGTGQPYISYNQLIFQPKKFFALGSPIGMFVTIRGIDKLGLDFRLPTCPGFYNIFHPFDPVAYRIEALVNPDMTGIRPVLIPHHKGRKRMHLELKETMTRVGADLKQRFFDTFKNTLESVNFLTANSKAKKEAEETMEKEVNSMLQMQMQVDQQDQQQHDDVIQPTSSLAVSQRTRTESVSTTVSDSDIVEIDFSLGKLNDSKRVDYVLQEAPLEFINEYIFALSSHVCYWESEDTILFVMKEIYAGLGISPDSQVPQQSMTIERPNSRNSVSQTLLPL